MIKKLKVSMIGLVMAASLTGLSFTAALAHPHAWVDMQTTVTFNEAGLIDGLDMTWSFDEAYAKDAIEGLDTNGDGFYSAAELEPLTQQNLEALFDYDYFTYPKAAGEAVKFSKPINAGQLYSNDRLQLHFRLPFVTPVDPHQQAFTLNNYDPEFYIDFGYKDSKTDIDVSGAIPAACKLNIKPVASSDELEQTRSMLATKGREWKPDENVDFGAMFSETVQINCAT